MTDPYAELKAHFTDLEGVVVNQGKGAQGIKVGKKMFAMFLKGDLLLKFPADRVQELVSSGVGEPYDPGTGKPMKDRVLIRVERKDLWIALCEESSRHGK